MSSRWWCGFGVADRAIDIVESQRRLAANFRIRYRPFRATEIPMPTTPPLHPVLHVPLRETVGAMKVLIGTALRVASLETATTALRALCDGDNRSATQAVSSIGVLVVRMQSIMQSTDCEGNSDGRLTARATYRSPGEHLDLGCGAATKHAWCREGETSGSGLAARWARWRSVAERFSKMPRHSAVHTSPAGG